MYGMPKRPVRRSPLAVTLARVAVVFGEEPRLQMGGADGPRWLALDGVLDRGLDLLFADREADANGARDYLGGSVAAALASAVISAGWPALLLDGRLPDLSPANLAVHRHETEGCFDRIALGPGHWLILEGDPAAGHAGTRTVSELVELHRLFAHALVEALEPWFIAIRRRAPFGRFGMWGQVADDLCATALWTARRAGLDQPAAWDEAQAVLDLVAGRVRELRARPRPFPVTWSGGEALFSIKATCCLWYKTQAAPDPCGEGYCGTCPFRDDASRRARLAGWLEEQEAAAG